jgi:undecaprenyl phosphate N,N'-diacetylbacillosamine 1-phosphate transferase
MKTEKKHTPCGPYEALVKRPLDLVTSGLALIFLSPVMVLVALGVRIKLGSPVIFSQARPGLNGKVFSIYKFRTMRDERDCNGELLPDEMRLTPFGKFLRAASLDELPEFFNILKGDMSLVGPRPLLPAYLPYYTEKEKRRHDVLPGLTGYAQVHGRNSVSWDRKFEMDVKYVEHITFMGDLKIIFRTILKVLAREDITSATSVTMESFIDYAKNRATNE